MTKRYQRGNQNPYIEEEQTTQWPKDTLCCLFFFDIRILITSLVSFGHCAVCSSSIYGFWLPLWYLLAIVLSVLLRYTDSHYFFCILYSGRVSISYSTSGTRRVNLVTNPGISHDWGKDREVFTTSGTYPWSFVTQVFHSGQPSYFICSNIPTAPVYRVYISQLIWYTRVCSSYQDFLDRGLLLTRMLLNQGFLLVKLKTSPNGQTTIYKTYI
jgi:hypothetical protein